jgi:hypothetical protein
MLWLVANYSLFKPSLRFRVLGLVVVERQPAANVAEIDGRHSPATGIVGDWA